MTRVPVRLPSVVSDYEDAHMTRARAARDLEAFCGEETAKPPALPRGTTLIPALRPQQSAQGKWVGSVFGGLEALRPWSPNVQTRPLKQVAATCGAMVLALVTVFSVLILRAPSMQQAPNYSLMADSVGNALGAEYAAPRQSAPTDTGAWQAYAQSVSSLGGGGASAPNVNAVQPAPATTAPATTAPAPTAPPQPTATARPQATATRAPAAPPPAPQPPATGILPPPVHPWPPSNPWMRVPGHTPYPMHDYAGDPYAYAFGQCTWWAQYERRDENLRGMGNARYWAGNAPRRGLRVGTTPVVGSTAVFQPGVQGAGWAGHVAHVMALYPGGWFLVSEMNAYGNGGGLGWVSYRYVHTGPGVQFIY